MSSVSASEKMQIITFITSLDFSIERAGIDTSVIVMLNYWEKCLLKKSWPVVAGTQLWQHQVK